MNDILGVAATLAALAKKLSKVDAFARSVAKQEGPAGKDGINGLDGKDGKDGADGLDGFSGADGKDGANGRDGINGKDGANGRDGINGKDGAKGDKGDQGEKGDQGPIPDHQWQGTKLRWQKPGGKWGKYVDLKGEAGKAGDNGGIVVVNRGGSGSSSGGLSGLLPGSAETDPTGIAVLQGGQWVNLSWQAFISAVSGAIDMGSILSRRIDFVGDTLIYRGEAAPGADETALVWRVKRIEFVTDGTGKQDIVEKWAGGDGANAYAWSDRAGLVYA